MRTAAILILCLMLAGCAAAPVTPTPTPSTITVCTEPPVIVKPVLSLSVLNEESMKGKSKEEVSQVIIQSYVLTVGELIEHVNYLTRIIEGYRHK